MHEPEQHSALYSAGSGSVESTLLLSAFNEDNKIHEENAFEWYLKAFSSWISLKNLSAGSLEKQRFLIQCWAISRRIVKSFFWKFECRISNCWEKDEFLYFYIQPPKEGCEAPMLYFWAWQMHLDQYHTNLCGKHLVFVSVPNIICEGKLNYKMDRARTWIPCIQRPEAWGRAYKQNLGCINTSRMCKYVSHSAAVHPGYVLYSFELLSKAIK